MSMKIQCDVVGIDPQCHSFLRRGKIFWSSYYLHHIHLKENAIELWCVGYLKVYFDTGSIYSLEHHCNVACVSQFYCYQNRFHSNDRSCLITENHVFLRSTCLSRWAHPYMVDWSVDCTIPCGHNSFFSRTVCMWNSICAEFVIFLPLRDEKYKTSLLVITKLNLQ